jgi:hypothetical protein
MNMDTQPYVTHTNVAEKLGIPSSVLNNIMANKKNILHQYVTSHPGRKKLKTSKYEKIESVLLEWFRQK